MFGDLDQVVDLAVEQVDPDHAAAADDGARSRDRRPTAFSGSSSGLPRKSLIAELFLERDRRQEVELRPAQRARARSGEAAVADVVA